MPSVASTRNASWNGCSLRCRTSGLDVHPMVAATASPKDRDKQRPATGHASERKQTTAVPFPWMPLMRLADHALLPDSCIHLAHETGTDKTSGLYGGQSS